MRLIDVDDAIEKINCLCVDDNENWIGTENQSFVDHADVIDILSSIPTVDAVPVVHGRCKKSEFRDEWYTYDYTCLECGATMRVCDADGNDIAPNLCPNCGAKLDGGNEDG